MHRIKPEKLCILSFGKKPTPKAEAFSKAKNLELRGF